MLRALAAALLSASLALPALAQSQAANGSIEGTITDVQGGVLPGVNVSILNTDTGASRLTVSNEDGFYRGLLLPLGTYRVSAELPGFRKFERVGIVLQAGQTAVINVELTVGNLSEAITVSVNTPVADPGKIDLGRTISDAEIHNLPLPSRNPYNFAFLQANVTGYENNELGVPRINANGSQMRTNYLLDGNTNTEKDRAGLRLLPVSEVLVREVKVVTNGFAPEFGQTTGMVYNAITQSGTNDVHGTASYRFKRNAMSAPLFFLTPGARKPDTEADDATLTLGGPIARNKAHFFGAYEFIDRSLVTTNSVIAVTPADASALGISLGDGVIPAHQRVNFGFGKVDYQLGANTLVTGRYLLFKNFSPSNVPGQLTTVDRVSDFTDRMDSAAVQAATTLNATSLNELRVQFARRHQFRTIGDGVAGPAITISGVALFGGPRIGDGNSVGFDFSQKIWQVLDNYTRIRDAHVYKFGADVQFIGDERVAGDNFNYTFPSVQAYLDAKSGVNRLGYTTLEQTFGQLDLNYSSVFGSFFLQDDWQIAPSIKLLYGLRYDVFNVPAAKPFALNVYSNGFVVDKNNWGPRAGVAWSLDDNGRTVLRASIGKMYEPPLLDFYDGALLNSGDPLRYNVRVSGTADGAPAFPTSLAAPPASFTLPRQSITAVDNDFRTQYAWLSNLQVERALTPDVSASVGYVNAEGRNLPVLMETNLIPSGNTLADGRPIYSTSVTPFTRIDPTFDHVNVVKSIGDASYNALTATLSRRMKDGWQIQATYTLARGVDNAPLTSTYVVGSGDDRVSDPSNLGRDKGVTPFNQTHTLAVSGVIAPKVTGDALGTRLANNNQVGIILMANSGLPFNIRSNLDLNADGVTNDRLLYQERNAGRFGTVFDVSLRYSRFVQIRSSRIEPFFEAKNLFNRQNVSGVNRVVPTDAAGIALSAVPSPFSGTAAYDQRIMQVGAKVSF
ncbi:MAG: TonB-dependent receptor [Vicinamibacterales bacterium]